MRTRNPFKYSITSWPPQVLWAAALTVLVLRPSTWQPRTSVALCGAATGQVMCTIVVIFDNIASPPVGSADCEDGVWVNDNQSLSLHREPT